MNLCCLCDGCAYGFCTSISIATHFLAHFSISGTCLPCTVSKILQPHLFIYSMKNVFLYFNADVSRMDCFWAFPLNKAFPFWLTKVWKCGKTFLKFQESLNNSSKIHQRGKSGSFVVSLWTAFMFKTMFLILEGPGFDTQLGWPESFSYVVWIFSPCLGQLEVWRLGSCLCVWVKIPLLHLVIGLNARKDFPSVHTGCCAVVCSCMAIRVTLLNVCIGFPAGATVSSQNPKTSRSGEIRPVFALWWTYIQGVQ